MSEENMKKITVVLSTYNGEKYLGEQLDSILRQKGAQVRYSLKVLCRDDGSKDRTRDILTHYSVKYPNVDIAKNSGKSLGVRKSFFSLLAEAQADYYFFSDQDDVWHLNKIQTFLDAFEETREDLPAGVYSDLDLVDGQNRPLGKSMMESNGWSYSEKRDFILFFFKTRVTGASFAINEAAKRQILKLSANDLAQVGMHDSILALLARAYNNLKFIPTSLVNYRQHGNNVLGAFAEGHSVFAVKVRIKRYRTFFNDLALVNSILSTKDLPNRNQAALQAAINFNGAIGFLNKLRMMFKDKKILWNEITPKQKLLLLLFY
ncbi:Alpha-L-Rha alpha-1 3-L-rhamnosyltransferase [Lactiplantibacillus plantarum]|nr:glycosyltransferase (rhamnosyltransferase), family 2 (GT2) [Lactiplantibacillus plantarum subsp. plantarum NC8]KFL88975.1 Alpha-L-Rha alpha-1,3-L-rhamnosyltransferase [Lactiplantibacillus plantarum]KZU15662.1 Alpha-L-Rha alpha-1 3-L-rhamnosyltransferase [Lactiplantibacillus plantarum]QDJ19505.1 glycosyltransferase family 2 protein [Lactiplantibacillus plantarum]